MSALPKYPTVSKNGVVTHVLVPIEEFERLASDATTTPAPPTDAEIDAAIAIFNDPTTRWHDGEEVFRELVRDGIKKIRRSTGLTQTELGGRIGMSQSQISRIESQPDHASLAILRRIADALLASHPSTGT